MYQRKIGQGLKLIYFVQQTPHQGLGVGTKYN